MENIDLEMNEQNRRTYLKRNFLDKNEYKFSDNILGLLRALDNLPTPTLEALSHHEFKDPNSFLLYSILGGWFGLDRFLQGQVGLGILKLITCGGFYIWWLIDMCTIKSRIKKQNLEEFYKYSRF